jgi:hypothetical protein
MRGEARGRGGRPTGAGAAHPRFLPPPTTATNTNTPQFGRLPFRWPARFKSLPEELQGFIRTCVEVRGDGTREASVGALLAHPFLAGGGAAEISSTA